MDPYECKARMPHHRLTEGSEDDPRGIGLDAHRPVER